MLEIAAHSADRSLVERFLSTLSNDSKILVLGNTSLCQWLDAKGFPSRSLRIESFLLGASAVPGEFGACYVSRSFDHMNLDELKRSLGILFKQIQAGGIIGIEFDLNRFQSDYSINEFHSLFRQFGFSVTAEATHLSQPNQIFWILKRLGNP